MAPKEPLPDSYDDDPMDVDTTRVENTKDLATVEGKINGEPVSVVLDSASNRDIMPESLVHELGLEHNTGKNHSIRGVSGVKESAGTCACCIELATPGCDIKADFVIVKDYPIREVILGRNTLRRYNYDLHESRKHVAITCNGEDFFIPIVPDINRQKSQANHSAVIIALEEQ